MVTFPRFDSGDRQPATDAELRRRWRTFLAAVRASSSNRMARWLGPLLGDETWRRTLALRAEQLLLRPRAHELTPTVKPLDWQLLVPRRTAGTVDETAVAVVVVDETDLVHSRQRISEALDSTATWILLVDQDRGGEQALPILWAARHEADVIFADERASNTNGALLKTAAVGPHTLLSVNIVGRPALIRCSAWRSIGGVSSDAGIAFEHDLYLRLVEAKARFIHLPVLLPGGRPFAHADLPALTDDTIRVVEAALARRGHRANVTPTSVAGVVNWTISLDEPPAVVILIPTRDRLDLLVRCIASIEERTTYPNYSITILDNDSVETETLTFFATTSHSVVRCPGPFNYAAIMNQGVAATTAPWIVTLNNDTVVITSDWLERLLSVGCLTDVALVGCRQVHADGSHDHDGIVIAPYPQHLVIGSNWGDGDYFSSARRDCSAVTGAVTLVRRTAWDGVGGMDETFPVVMNDVDLCLRLQNEGGHVVMVPDVVLRHDVSSSRGRLDPLDDRNRFVRRWDIFGSFIDPYFPERVRLYGHTMVILADDANAPSP